MRVPNNKVELLIYLSPLKGFRCFNAHDGSFFLGPPLQVGLVIGKGGETIKNIQARTGARVQVCC